MELLQQLTASGALDAAALDWAQEALNARPGPLELSLLELDLIDEDGLARALEACHGLPVATTADLASADPAAGRRLPRSAADAFRLCPLLIEGNQLVALVEVPLPSSSLLELLELFQLEVTQLLALEHTLEMAASAVYGAPVSPRVQRLEERLARQRQAVAQSALGRLVAAPDLEQAVASVLDFAERVVDHAVLLYRGDSDLRVVAARPGAAAAGLPYPGGSLAAALQYGGYFLGPLHGGADDDAFFAALGRAAPRWAFVAPVPGRPVAFVADNGDRPIAPRWVAELTLLVSRLAQRGEEWDTGRWAAWADAASDALERAMAGAVEATKPPAAAEPPAAPVEEPPAAPVEEPPAAPVEEPAAAAEPAGASAVEQAVLARLRKAAEEAGLPLEQLVDQLLAGAAARPPAAALAGEVKELFDRLATDIPSQLAKGMEAAFRGLAPRLAASPATAAPATPAPSPAASAAAGVELVQSEAKPREVQSYRARRSKVARRKL